MTSSRALTVLVVLIALLAIVVTAAGVFTGGGPGPSTFTTINGTTTSIYGVGLYQKDSLLLGPDIGRTVRLLMIMVIAPCAFRR